MTKAGVRIAGLDFGLSLGWSVLNDGAYVVSGVEVLKGLDHYAEVFHRFDLFVDTLITTHKPQYIGYEKPPPTLRSYAQIVFHGQLALLWMRCKRRGVGFDGVAVPTLKKFATGHGRAGKDMMIESAFDYVRDSVGRGRVDEGLKISHDEADAIHVARWMHSRPDMEKT